MAHLSELEGNLITSTPVGGLPETAKEQFEKFMVRFFFDSLNYSLVIRFDIIAYRIQIVM